MKPSINSIFDCTTPTQFEKIVLDTFRYQASENKVYKQYIDGLKINTKLVNSIQEIPFLPIEFFKTQIILSEEKPSLPQQLFTSSGTTSSVQSKHYVSDISIYEKSYQNGFKHFYGNIEDYCILALLPSYLEREGSSLIYMANDLIKLSKHPDSGFYLDNYQELLSKIKQLKNQKVILLGVTYALLDLAELATSSTDFNNVFIMETGGMKGKRAELVREELHTILCNSLEVKHIHSEYGMTELLSQAYSKGEGIFDCPPWMKVIIRDINDPFTILPHNKTGGINVIDLANINSCSFIATQDLGKSHSNDSFEVLGRFDNSDIRGCNLLVE